jgi:hypothetical protein
MVPALPKSHKDIGMEGMVAKWYAANTGKSLDESTKLARRIACQLPPGSSVLEVARARVISPSSCRTRGQERGRARVHVDFRQGSASKMPFANGASDFLLCRAAFKNFGDTGNVPGAQSGRPWFDHRPPA